MAMVVIEDWVLSTVHMWILKFNKEGAQRLLVEKISSEKVYEAHVKLSEEVMIQKPVKHRDNSSGPGEQQIARDLINAVYDLDQMEACPRYIVGSRELAQIPFTSSSLAEPVALGSRMEELENTVNKLVNSFETFKNNVQVTTTTPAVVPTFASVAAATIGNKSSHDQGQVDGQPGQILGGGTRSRVDSLSGRGGNVGGRLSQRIGRERIMSFSEKRKAEDHARGGEHSSSNDENMDQPFQFQRRPRRVNYGNCKGVEVVGGEAAPYEVFIGNTNPASTPDIIEEVLKKCADQLPEDLKPADPLQILQVQCLSRPNEDGEPLRTKCWKVQVPNKYREHMLRDEAYPYGWSHRRFFPKRNQRQQREVPPLDPSAPKRPHLSVTAAPPTATV